MLVDWDGGGKLGELNGLLLFSFLQQPVET